MDIKTAAKSAALLTAFCFPPAANASEQPSNEQVIAAIPLNTTLECLTYTVAILAVARRAERILTYRQRKFKVLAQFESLLDHTQGEKELTIQDAAQALTKSPTVDANALQQLLQWQKKINQIAPGLIVHLFFKGEKYVPHHPPHLQIDAIESVKLKVTVLEPLVFARTLYKFSNSSPASKKIASRLALSFASEFENVVSTASFGFSDKLQTIEGDEIRSYVRFHKKHSLFFQKFLKDLLPETAEAFGELAKFTEIPAKQILDFLELFKLSHSLKQDLHDLSEAADKQKGPIRFSMITPQRLTELATSLLKRSEETFKYLPALGNRISQDFLSAQRDLSDFSTPGDSNPFTQLSDLLGEFANRTRKAAHAKTDVAEEE